MCKHFRQVALKMLKYTFTSLCSFIGEAEGLSTKKKTDGENDNDDADVEAEAETKYHLNKLLQQNVKGNKPAIKVCKAKPIIIFSFIHFCYSQRVCMCMCLCVYILMCTLIRLQRWKFYDRRCCKYTNSSYIWIENVVAVA